MFSLTLLLLLKSMFWSLRLGTCGSSFPRALNPEEESRLLKSAASGDKAARDKLIEHNLRLVAHICKKFYSRDTHEDLISIGTVGLIKGIDTFNLNLNAKLSTYVSRCIENEILMHFRKERKSQTDVSLNDMIDSENEDSGLSLMDTLSGDTNLLEELNFKENCARVTTLVRTVLDNREETIITNRYGLGNTPPRTQSEVAYILRISRSYVSRLEKKAIEKLRVHF
ncbi:MAG: sigma-70 family RNA polymerase sigma factor [Oscillospiraceae bacterium]|jgi:RNA polymerase sporulation-specific sigma factor|nr:sigma-70 family RNA polymerase sigma factor [Oscillospiraceae bacterium]